jgi:CDP-glucose 4,6-dehydratase
LDTIPTLKAACGRGRSGIVTGLADALTSFYRGRRVLVTGHTGFKGSWLVLWLRKMGATAVGVALPPVSPLSLFCSGQLDLPDDRVCDVRSLAELRAVFEETKPDIVFHLAAQAIVGLSYQDPVGTFETNVMGTANVLECVRTTDSVAAAVIITSDKCYENVEQLSGYREDDRLGGIDPYSASKAGAEIVVSSFTRSFLREKGTANVASARAGNVVGGGDWSEFRLIPDCIRSLRAKASIRLRSPHATRPWQFVLEPIAGYLLLGMRLSEEGKAFQGAWNFGPPGDSTKTVEVGAQSVVDGWGEGAIEHVSPAPFHESKLLQLDSTKARQLLGWRPVLDFSGTMALTTQWYKHQYTAGDASTREYSLGQLGAFEERLNRDVLL